jgi:hypothetical protein
MVNFFDKLSERFEIYLNWTDMNKNVIFSRKIPILALKGLTGASRRIGFGPVSTGQAKMPKDGVFGIST